MSSVGLSGLSNISNDTLQGRYEKALKQINKLIEINRELKQRVGEYQGEVGALEGQVQGLQQANHELDEESNLLDAKYMELNAHYQQLEDYCKTLEEKLDASHLSSQEIDLRLKQAETKYQQSLQLEAERYNVLLHESEQLQQEYQEGLLLIQQHEEEQGRLLAERDALLRENAELKVVNVRLGEAVTEKHIVQLEGQLEQATRNVERLVKECNELRGRQIDFEVLQQKQKVERYIGLSTSINDQQGDAVKELIQQYKRKLSSLQAEKREVEGKYKALKGKCKNADNYQKKIDSLQRLTEKQQREIARIIQTYDRQLNAIHKENVKIREAYVSVSQSLSKRGAEVSERDKAISELKMTGDRMSFENESLRKVNFGLIEEKENKLKELSILKDKIQHTESFTLGQVRSCPDGEEGEKVKLKISQVQKGIYSVPSSRLDDPFMTSAFAKEEGRIPITVSYSPTSPSDKGDFKFIQSVNIINGYNVSLGENSSGRSNQ